MSPGRRPPPFREAAPGLCPPHSTAVLPHAQMALPGLQSVLMLLVLALGTTKQNLAPSPCPSSADQHCSDSPSLLSSRCTALGVSACPHHEVLQAPSSSAGVCPELGSPAVGAVLQMCSPHAEQRAEHPAALLATLRAHTAGNRGPSGLLCCWLQGGQCADCRCCERAELSPAVRPCLLLAEIRYSNVIISGGAMSPC